jgi:formamidopyrimidine-DNA glycosylase
MPELPEVETVCRGLQQSLAGERISDVQLHRTHLRIPIPEDFSQRCLDQTITHIERRAKYFLIHLQSGDVILGHLGMSGRMLVYNQSREHLEKHDHVCFLTESGMEVVFNDPRRFGLLSIAHKEELAQHKLLKNLGIEPLSDDFTDSYLQALLNKRNVAIKQAIMNANLVVGVGNIYASEALFKAKIHPQTLAKSLSLEECARLSQAIKIVLVEAIRSGGSTLRDYVGSSGDTGYFQHQFKVYGRENMSCFDCNFPIKRLQQAKRSTFVCESCQILE